MYKKYYVLWYWLLANILLYSVVIKYITEINVILKNVVFFKYVTDYKTISERTSKLWGLTCHDPILGQLHSLLWT